MVKRLKIDSRILLFDPDNMKNVNSSNVKSIGSGTISETGEIVVAVNFKKDPTLYYFYLGFSISVIDKILKSESVGKFLNSTIYPQATETYKAVIK